MRTPVLKVLLVGISIVAVAAIIVVSVVFFPTNEWQQFQTRRQIQRLGSSTFDIKRDAQLRILRMGKVALPELLGALGTTSNDTQLALVCSLIGAIDPITYKEVLLYSNSVQNVCVFARYLNPDAIRGLAVGEREAIVQYYRQILPSLAAERRKCAEAIVQAAEITVPKVF